MSSGPNSGQIRPSSSPGTQLSVSETFASQNAQYLQYLDALRPYMRVVNGMDIAMRVLQADIAALDQLMELEPSQSTTKERRADLLAWLDDRGRGSIAHVLDTRTDGKICEHATLRLISQHSQVAPVNNFVKSLHECDSDVHTRVILLRRPLTFEELEAPRSKGVMTSFSRFDYIKAAALAWKLLCHHILGVELGIKPPEVEELLSRDFGGVEWRPTKLDTMMLGDGPQGSISKYLGPRRIDKGSPFLVLVMIGEREASHPWIHHDLIGLPSPESILQRGRGDRQSVDWITSPWGSFHHMLSESLAGVPTLTLGHPCGHWMQPLLVQHSARLNSALSAQLQRLSGEPGPDTLESLRHSRVVLEEELRAARSMQSYAGYPLGDVSTSGIDMLVRVARQLEDREQHLRAKFEASVQQRSLDSAELSIQESRSAIALTVLAFAFIPLSLASSIFGMNVQEINGTGHGITTFVITSVVMLLVSLLSWMSWRMWRNASWVLRLYREYLTKDFHRDRYDHRLDLTFGYGVRASLARRVLPLAVFGYDLLRHRSWASRVALVLGWESAEKTVKA